MEPSPHASPSDPARSPRRALANVAAREFSAAPLVDWVMRRPAAVIIGFGVLFRVVQYLTNRPTWLDESSLQENIVTKSLPGLFGPLERTQLAPPGFLVVEWLASRSLGASNLALRLFPLVCGVFALVLFHRVALRCLRPHAVLIALALFAVSGDLIYYASELKQYSTDVTVALACDLQAMALVGQPATRGRLCRFAAIGMAAVWFSHPSAFVLAGLGTPLLVLALVQRDWRRFCGLALTCASWVISFAGVYLVAQEQLAHRNSMWVFWGFAFPPQPLGLADGAVWGARRLLYLVVNPLDFSMPFVAPRISFLPAAACLAFGCVSMARRAQGTLLAMLVGPVLFTLLAAYIRQYPFHGRLLIFLIPGLLLLVAEGAAWIGDRANRRAVWIGLIVVLLAVPTVRALDGLFEPTITRVHNPFGDFRPPGLVPDAFPL